MRKKELIARASAEEVGGRIKRGGDRTDWARAKAMPQAAVERLADEDEGPLPEGWEGAVMIGLPPRKKDVHIRLDADVVDWFKSRGAGY